MPRRNTDSRSRRLDPEDRPIGLTGAFAPVRGPQSVDYDAEDDPVGLTQAFGAIPHDDSEHDWSSSEKWKNFSWGDAEEEKEADRAGAILGVDEALEDGEDAAIENLDEDIEEFYDDGDKEIDSEESAEHEEKAEKRSKKERGSSGPKHGRHAAAEPELSPRMKKSKRTRKVLIVLVILLVLIIAALGYFMVQTYSDSQQEAAQQTQEQTTSPREDLSTDSADDATESTKRLADVPDLARILGMTQDEAIEAIGHGALVTSNRDVNEEGNPIKKNLNVALTEEAADSKTGTPTVYLGLNEAGRVLQVGYSASASALGFSALSFADAVGTEHVVEKTLAKIGVDIPEGSAVLPQNKADYTTYASDGTTIVRERCSFEGRTEVNGTPCVWSSVLSYDYTTQVVTGNLTDTVRIIYVYITAQ